MIIPSIPFFVASTKKEDERRREEWEFRVNGLSYKVTNCVYSGVGSIEEFLIFLRDIEDNCEKAGYKSIEEKSNYLEYYLEGPSLQDWEYICDSVGVDEKNDDIAWKCRIESFKENVIMDQWAIQNQKQHLREIRKTKEMTVTEFYNRLIHINCLIPYFPGGTEKDLLTDHDLCDIFLLAMPKKWQFEFKAHCFSIREKTLNQLYMYMISQEDNHSMDTPDVPFYGSKMKKLEEQNTLKWKYKVGHLFFEKTTAMYSGNGSVEEFLIFIRDFEDECEKLKYESVQQKTDFLKMHLQGLSLFRWKRICDMVVVEKGKEGIAWKKRLDEFKKAVIVREKARSYQRKHLRGIRKTEKITVTEFCNRLLHINYLLPYFPEGNKGDSIDDEELRHIFFRAMPENFRCDLEIYCLFIGEKTFKQVHSTMLGEEKNYSSETSDIPFYVNHIDGIEKQQMLKWKYQVGDYLLIEMESPIYSGGASVEEFLQFIRVFQYNCKRAKCQSIQQKTDFMNIHLQGLALHRWKNICDTVAVKENDDEVAWKTRLDVFKERVIVRGMAKSCQKEDLRYVRKSSKMTVDEFYDRLIHINCLLAYFPKGSKQDLYDNYELGRIFFNAMPEKWKDTFKSHNGSTQRRINDMYFYMKGQEEKASREEKDEFLKKRGRHSDTIHQDQRKCKR